MKLAKNSNVKILLFFFTFILFIYLYGALIMKPVVGMADNGDFFRAMNNEGFYYLTQNYEDRHVGYFNRLYGIRQYTYDKSDIYISTLSPLVKAAKGLNNVFTKGTVFDIRFLAVIYSILFLLIYYYGMKLAVTRFKMSLIACCTFSLLIFADIGYVAYFNSFYGEAATYIFFLALIITVFYISTSDKPSIKQLILFSTVSLLFAASKQQHYILGVLLALFSLRLIAFNKQRAFKIACIASFTVITTASILMFTTVADDINVINRYFSITRGVLLETSTPETDLNKVGLDPSFSLLAGSSYYDSYNIQMPESAYMNKNFYPNFSYASLARFYISNPSKLKEKLTLSAQNGYAIRPAGLGNFEKEEGRPFGDYSKIGLWSRFKLMAIPKSVNFMLLYHFLFFIILALLEIREYRKKRAFSLRCLAFEVMALVPVISMLQIAVSFIGSGDNDLSKHLFLYNVSFDIMFYCYASVGIYYAMIYIKSNYRKVGVTKWLAEKPISQ